MSNLYYAAAIQVDQPNPRTREDMASNTSRMLALLERAVEGYRPFHDVKLAVFPEFAHAAPAFRATSQSVGTWIDSSCQYQRPLCPFGSKGWLFMMP